ncbi:MAG: hypothetical protein ACERKD_08920 [Prolixibacteraceae bacterium]
MEKSIENMWKEGFLKSDALVAPKINKLYNHKSKHITAKFERVFKINLIAIVVFSVVFLITTIYNGLPVIGISWFLILSGLVIVNSRLMNGLNKINNHANSYEYLVSFNKWLKNQISINRKMARFYYPLFFLTIVIGFWLFDAEGIPLGERLVGEVLYGFPDILMINGIPLFAIVFITVVVGILALFGGRIYMWDVNLIYGSVFKKLEELMADIEELKN